jgi:hypothetical protein
VEDERDERRAQEERERAHQRLPEDEAPVVQAHERVDGVARVVEVVPAVRQHRVRAAEHEPEAEQERESGEALAEGRRHPLEDRRGRAGLELGAALRAARRLGVVRGIEAPGAVAPRARHVVRLAAERRADAARPAARRAAGGVVRRVLGGAHRPGR